MKSQITLEVTEAAHAYALHVIAEILAGDACNSENPVDLELSGFLTRQLPTALTTIFYSLVAQTFDYQEMRTEDFWTSYRNDNERWIIAISIMRTFIEGVADLAPTEKRDMG